MWGELHELKVVDLTLDSPIEPYIAQKMFSGIGGILKDDLYSFECKFSESWQATDLVYITLRSNGLRVFSYDIFDEIQIDYLFSHRPIEDQVLALNLIDSIVSTFGGTARYQNKKYARETALADWNNCNKFLWQEWAEKPGNESLAVMVEENYEK